MSFLDAFELWLQSHLQLLTFLTVFNDVIEQVVSAFNLCIYQLLVHLLGLIVVISAILVALV